MSLLVATTNPGKVREFRDLLGPDRFAFHDLSDHRDIPVVEETGRTFRDNASLKAAWYAQRLNAWTLADDSGLAVDALGGKPGVTSARWAELHHAGKGDAANNALLLQQLEPVPDGCRTSRFVCVLALSGPQGRIVLTAMDTVEARDPPRPPRPKRLRLRPSFLGPRLRQDHRRTPPRRKARPQPPRQGDATMQALMRRIGFGEPGFALHA